MNKMGIVIVNWNGWADTVECLEAVLRIDGFRGPVVVCDNASTDNSIEMIQDWGSGMFCPLPESREAKIRSIVTGGKKRKINLVVLTEADAKNRLEMACDESVFLVLCSANHGFAGGNNVGIRFLISNFNLNWFWLLNSDALPQSDIYKLIVDSDLRINEPQIFGTTLIEYWDSNTIQACGADFRRISLYAKHRYEGRSVEELNGMPDVSIVSYPVGASLFVNSVFIDTVGLMSEEYFLYHEEIDWVVRHGWPSKAFILTKAIVYHKGGASVGNSKGGPKSVVADYYTLRGRILLAKKMGMGIYFMSLAISCYAILKRLFAFGPGKRFVIAARAIRDGVIGIKGKVDLSR